MKNSCSVQLSLAIPMFHCKTRRWKLLHVLIGWKEQGNRLDMKTKVGSVLCHTPLRCYEAVELQGTGAAQTSGAAEPTRRG